MQCFSERSLPEFSSQSQWHQVVVHGITRNNTSKTVIWAEKDPRLIKRQLQAILLAIHTKIQQVRRSILWSKSQTLSQFCFSQHSQSFWDNLKMIIDFWCDRSVYLILSGIKASFFIWKGLFWFFFNMKLSQQSKYSLCFFIIIFFLYCFIYS